MKPKMSTSADPRTYDMSAIGDDHGMPDHNPELNKLNGAYKEYLGKYQAQFLSIAKSGADGATSDQMGKISATLHTDNIDIATSLDVANQMLMLHTLDKMSVSNASTDIGYGSDSDIEDGDIHGKKIVTHNGMRSLITATDSARNLLFKGATESVGIAYDHPYYETENAIKQSNIKVENVKGNRAEAGIVIKDINACITDGPPDSTEDSGIATEFRQAKAWIIDTTSATTSQMKNVYQQFKDAESAKVLYFSSSGLKNEQGGADNNNYGTVRVFAKSDGKKRRRRWSSKCSTR